MKKNEEEEWEGEQEQEHEVENKSSKVKTIRKMIDSKKREKEKTIENPTKKKYA